tara:strand:+ start:1437 stop:2057 length:621 start_codon:yes stop_codon:yes gene_type:complete
MAITIINYGIGNINSIYSMYKNLGIKVKVSESINDIKNATRLILPGVGAFDKGIRELRRNNLEDVLNEAVINQKKPIMGICLGYQLFFSTSEEGSEKGLSWINGSIKKLKKSNDIKLRYPHMGWNGIQPHFEHPIFEGLDNNMRFYFAHSYYVKCITPSDILASSIYGHKFTSAILKENIIGFQFHPEKSLKWGMKILYNFANVSI